MTRHPDAVLILSLCACGVLLLLVALMFGSIPLSLNQIAMALTQQGDANVITIIWEIRLPRTVAAGLTGAALGASGAALQGLLRNPLAEPAILGVSASSACCATAIVYFGWAAVSPWLMPIGSLVGALIATSLLAGAAMRGSGVTTLILFGVAMSAMAGAIMALFVNLAPNPFSLSDLINWTAGSVANRGWSDIAIAAPFIFAGCGLLLLGKRSLSATALGEEVAHGLGVDLGKLRLLTIAGTGLATGGAVALAGMVGFIGLVAPHVVRPFVGHDAGAAIVPSILAGAMLVMLSDMAIRLMPWGNELHLGTIAALAGAPVFIWLVFNLEGMRRD